MVMNIDSSILSIDLEQGKESLLYDRFRRIIIDCKGVWMNSALIHYP
jgi:hypothetical protein